MTNEQYSSVPAEGQICSTYFEWNMLTGLKILNCMRGVRINTCARNRLKTWHKALVWNKAESFDYKAGNIVWEPLSWGNTGKILNSSEISGVISNTMSVKQKQRYPLIFAIIFFFFQGKKFLMLIFFLSHLLYFLIDVSMGFHWLE